MVEQSRLRAGRDRGPVRAVLLRSIPAPTTATGSPHGVTRNGSSPRAAGWWTGAIKTAVATLAYAAIHSALASHAAKNAATRTLGQRGRNALYRPFFIVQATAGFAALAEYIRRQPGRTLYDLHGPAAWLLRVGQAGALVFAVSAARQVGTGRMLGLAGLRAWGRRDRDAPIEPEAQGPALDLPSNRMKVTGPFRVSRHPLNFAPIPLFWLNPRMTSNFAAFAAVATLYFAVGSLHEEHRLRRAYGQPYEDYQHSTVRFLVPGSKDRALQRT
jgi:hypothetical protein